MTYEGGNKGMLTQEGDKLKNCSFFKRVAIKNQNPVDQSKSRFFIGLLVTYEGGNKGMLTQEGDKLKNCSFFKRVAIKNQNPVDQSKSRFFAGLLVD